ncbi:MAG TPA: phosphoribosylformylglycinamidine cyclo-ligase [Roseiflexaceae bacterium]|jgi:phosphoribosylformylglycinamidine cyclo-ligase|nr:phosphoribosylformylglycinamidine cyclo-ligase [Roseiflexaceae bacterium]
MPTYAQSGVNIAEASRANSLMAEAVRSTYTAAVLSGMGAFGGCFDLGAVMHGHQQPVLVASTDGVGTKTLVAAALGRYDTVGQDLVNHCINDILVQGARPLFFMDYIATAQLDAQHVAALVGGVATACRAAGCALLGGETAEMPDVYHDGAFDLAGTIVGVVDRARMLPHDVAVGDAILALPSNGLHTNGYSLARRVFGDRYDERPHELGGQTIGAALLQVHRSYLDEIIALQSAGVPLHGLAHITGGGVYDNLPRVLPDGAGALIRRESWDVPPIFELLVRDGKLDEREAFHALNMGLGMLVVVPEDAAEAARQAVPELRLVGKVTDHAGVQIV